MTVATELDVRGFSVTKYEYLLLEVTREVARDGAGQVQSSHKKTTAGSCSFVQVLLTRTGKPKAGFTQLQNHWQRDTTCFITQRLYPGAN